MISIEADCKYFYYITNLLNNTMKKSFNLLLISVLCALASCNPPAEEPMTFQISVTDTTAVSATVAVKPSVDTKAYFFTVDLADSVNRYESKEAYANEFLPIFADYIDDYNKEAGTSYTFEGEMSKGPDTVVFKELAPSSRYYVLAFQVDVPNKKCVGKVAFKEFTTLELQKSDNVITFVHNEGDTIITIQTTNNDTYIYTKLDKDVFNFYADETAAMEQYVAFLRDYLPAYFDFYEKTGTQTLKIKDEVSYPGTYVFMAANVKDMYINSPVFTKEITVTQEMLSANNSQNAAPQFPEPAAYPALKRYPIRN